MTDLTFIPQQKESIWINDSFYIFLIHNITIVIIIFLEFILNFLYFLYFLFNFNEVICMSDENQNKVYNLLISKGIDSYNEYEFYKERINSQKEFKWNEYNTQDDELNDEITHFNDIMAERIVVSNSIMQSTFHRYHFTDADGNERPQSKEETDLRVSNIVEMARQQVGSTCHCDTSYSPDIYRITQDTIDNTRELIAAGHKLVFDDWEKLDVIEKMLKSGDAVFALRVARDGDGYGDFYIYTENDSGCIGDINGLETIGCMD